MIGFYRALVGGKALYNNGLGRIMLALQAAAGRARA